VYIVTKTGYDVALPVATDATTDVILVGDPAALSVERALLRLDVAEPPVVLLVLAVKLAVEEVEP